MIYTCEIFGEGLTAEHNLYLVLHHEKSNKFYTTDFLINIVEEK